MENQINYLKSRLDAGEMDIFDFTLKNIDIVSIIEDTVDKGIEDDLFKALYILQYAYELTDIGELIPNELYDKLYEKYKDVSGKEFVGAKATAVYTGNKAMVEHRYPELRGSLDKVHFATDGEIPSKDTRKSLLSWITKAAKTLDVTDMMLVPSFKYDGLSVVLEFIDGELDRAITRGLVDDNLGMDITALFKGLSLESIFEDSPAVPEIVKGLHECAVKNEIIMTTDKFENYNKDFPEDKKKNTRSATSSIVNSGELSTELFKTYLKLKPLQISSKDDIDNNELIFVGDIDGKHQYVVENPDINRFIIHIDDMTTLDESMFIEQVSAIIDGVCNKAEEINLPIDGVVFTIDRHKDIIDKLGRKDNINKFQIAYKIPAGRAKTILKGVVFQVGALGGITPVAIVEPVVIMGNKIESPGLSNRDKMDRLDLNIGDEVIITYDIVPLLSKDSTCKKGDGPKVEFPSVCPVCKEELGEYGKIYRCDNGQCDSRMVGRIMNYLNKVGVKGIGEAIISTFIDKGIINGIGDLYRIPNHKEDILNMKGYAEDKYNNIINAIFMKNELYPHELLGALGIPDIGRSIMNKVCSEITMDELLKGDSPTLLHKLVLIKGIADLTAVKIVTGISNNRDNIDDIMKYVIIKPYVEKVKPDLTVLFTNVRDRDFEDFLALKNIKVASSYTKSVDLIIRDDALTKSTKVDKAEKDDKRVITISEAYKDFGYSI